MYVKIVASLVTVFALYRPAPAPATPVQWVNTGSVTVQTACKFFGVVVVNGTTKVPFWVNGETLKVKFGNGAIREHGATLAAWATANGLTLE